MSETASIQLPEDPNEEELAKDWSISPDDLEEVRRSRHALSKLHFAVQLCVLRKYGQFLYPFHVPLRIINHISVQIGLEPVLIVPDGPLHEQTVQEHEMRIRSYCGFDTFGQHHVEQLENHLIILANEGGSRESLYERGGQYLFDKRITPPGYTVLAKVVGSAYIKAERGIFDEILERVPQEFRKKIDQLLEASENGGVSALVRFREYPRVPRPDHILEYLDRYAELREMGATNLDLSNIKTDVIIQFYSLVAAYDVYRLKRFGENKRYSMVACFLSESARIILDYIVEMNDQYLTSMCRRARHAFEDEHREFRKKSKQGIETVVTALDGLLDKNANHSQTIGDWLKTSDQGKLSEAVEALRFLKTIEARGYYDHLKARYSHFRRYFPRFCELPFKAEDGASSMLSAVELLREMNKASSDEISDTIAEKFLNNNQRSILRNRSGNVPRAYAEILFALEMKDALRAGQLHLPESRKNISFWNMIHDPKTWKQESEQSYSDLKLPSAPKEIITRLAAEYGEAAAAFVKGLPDNPFAKIVNGELKLSRIEGTRVEVDAAKGFLEATLPKIRIEDALLDVHRRCGFLNEFKPLAGYDARPSEKHQRILLAALIAHGTNLGIAAMGNSTKGITVDELSHASRWFIRESTIKAANAVIVDYHHRMRLTKTWGDGSSSSSDGQRFGVEKSSLLATFYPRYFGHYDRAVTVYTHTSDQYSVYHTDVISCAAREAVFVLDGLLENSTLLRPQTHFTDTHGYTEHLFALCYLLGFSFMPRIKDLGDQRIYKLGADQDLDANFDNIFSGRIDLTLIEEQWDSIVRIAASLKSKTAPAHLIVGRLAKAPSADRLAKAITQLGRAVKTIFIFRYLSDEALRRRIHKQLNRGEARHQLAKHLFFANQGEFRDGDYEAMMHKASCLSLLSNTVLVANTAAIDHVIRTHPGAADVLNQADLARISPLLFRRVIPNGTYHFR